MTGRAISLKGALTLRFMLVGALPLLLVGMMALHVLGSRMADEIRDQNLLLARSLAGEVSRFLGEPLMLLEHSRSVIGQDRLIGDDWAVDRYLRTVMDHYRFFNMVQIIDGQGKIRHIAPLEPAFLGSDMSGHEFYRRTRSTGEAHWSAAFISQDTGKPAITLSIPDGDRVIVGYLDIDALNAMGDGIRIGETGYAVMVDGEGTVISHPRRRFVVEHWNLSHLPPVRAGMAGREGSRTFIMDGVETVGGVVSEPRTGWSILVVQSVAEAFAPVTQIRSLIVMGILTALALAGGAAFISLRQTLKPLLALTEGANKIARGDYRHKLTIDSYAEYNALAHHFRTMTESVRLREEALRQSEAQKNAILNGIGTHLAFLDKDLKIIWTNHPIKADPDAFQGRGCRRLWGCPETPCDDCPAEAVLRTGRRRQRTVRRRETEVWDEKVEPVTDPAGDLMGVLVIANDVTERFKATEALAHSQEQLREVMQNMPVMLNALDDAMRIIVWNAECERVTGYPATEILAHPKPLELLYPDPAYREEMIAEIIERDFYFRNREWTLTAKDGAPRTVAWSNISNRFPVPGWATWAVGFDLTDRKRSEEEKKELEARLRQAQKMEAIGNLTGGIAHDFNNILGAILGNAELAEKDVAPDHPAARYLDRIRTASLRARDVIRQLLSFSRKSEPRRRPIRLSAAVSDSLNLLRASIPATVAIQESFAAESDTVLADPSQIHQIVMNLCTNSAQAMGEAGGLLEIRIKTPADSDLPADLPPGDWVRLTVRDSGDGIPEAIRDKIFDPYFTTKPAGEGTGMGLSVVHGIVATHEGVIQVASAPGSGTAVHIFLPVLPGEAAPPPETTGPLPTGTERILLVDDEPFIADMAAEILTRLGYGVETETDPRAAAALIRDDPGRCALLISDMTMPGMTGDELARQAAAVRADLPVIICTGDSSRLPEEKVREPGIKAVVLKPFVMRDIAVLVRKVLDGDRL